MTNRQKRQLAELPYAFLAWDSRARVGFSAAGGTINVLAGEASRATGLPFLACWRAIASVVEGCDGWKLGAFFEPDRGDARGFGVYLRRTRFAARVR